MTFPAFEGSAQKVAGKHTLAAFVYRLRQTQWSFTQWKRPPGYGEPGLKFSICSELQVAQTREYMKKQKNKRIEITNA